MLQGLCCSLPAVRRPQAAPRAVKGDESARTCTRKHYFQRASPSKPCHSPGRASGGRVPSGRVCAPALPGEVCKHSCSRAGETAGSEAARATPSRGGRKGPAGGGGSQTKAWTLAGDTPAAATPGCERALQRTKISPEVAGNRLPHTLQEGHTRPRGGSRERGGCQLGQLSEGRLFEVAFQGALSFS